MELDVWISHEGEKIVNWNGDDWAKDTVNNELAETRSPYFPCGHDAFSKVSILFNSGNFKKGWIDDITKYVLVPKSEIIKLINELYCNLPHINKRLDELKDYVNNLPQKEYYKLVQQEF
jgi:hypothetical protein